MIILLVNLQKEISTKNEGGTVSYDEKTVKVNDIKNIETLKHELLHAIKGEKRDFRSKNTRSKKATL